MFQIALFLSVIYGIIITIRAVVDTALGEAWKASRNMLILMLILIACAFYIYFTRNQLVLNIQ